MWVELRQPCRVTGPNGRQILHYPGDVVEIKNKARAVDLVKRKIATSVGTRDDTLEGMGVVQRSGGTLPQWLTALEIPIVSSKHWELLFHTTIFWHPIISVKYSGLRATLHALRSTQWEVAAPLYSYMRLCDVMGTREDREYVAGIIPDLRVPAYEINFLLVQKNARTDLLFEHFRGALAVCPHERLAFMTALYKTQPYILPLPLEWARKRP